MFCLRPFASFFQGHIMSIGIVSIKAEGLHLRVYSFLYFFVYILKEKDVV